MSFLHCEHLIADKPRVLTNINMSKIFKKDDCSETVRNKVKTDKFDLVNYELEDLPEHGDVFNEKTRILRVKIHEPGKSGWTLLKFFIKELPDGTKDSKNAFTKEGEIYSSVLPEIRKYLRGKVFPECYFAKNNEVVVLEDLSLSGYKARNDYIPYDESHIDAVLSAIANYHAASLVSEKKRSRSVADLMPDGGKELMFIQDTENPIFDFFCSSINTIESVMEAYFSYYERETFERAKKLLTSIPERLKIIDKDCKFKVFSHGDLWNNNIMFNYTDEGEVNSAVIFDFQLCKYTTPAFDVLQAVYLTTLNLNVNADQFYEERLVFYFNGLSRYLAEQDVSIHGISTWAEFKATADSMRPVMLAIAPLCLHFMLLPKEVVKKHMTKEDAREAILKQDRSEIVLHAMTVNENYRRRITHSVRDMLEYLKTHK